VPKKIRLKIKESRNRKTARHLKQLIESEVMLSEGVWSKIKYYVAKYGGSMEKGGVIFGRGKKAEKAEEFVKSVLQKKGNEFIKKLDDELKQANEEFPNQEDKYEFQNSAASILAVYWSIVAAAGKCGEGVECGEGIKNLRDGEDGFLPVPIANEIIKDLESYAKYIANYKIADSYKHFLEEDAPNQITKTPTFNLTESEIQRMDEIFGLSSKEKMAKQVAASERGEDIEGPDSEREDLFGKGKKTHAYQGLESNLLPGVLALLGAGFTAAHFVAMAFLPKNVPKLSYKYSWVTKHMKGAMGKNITLGGAPGNGVLKILGNATGSGTAKLGGDFVDQIKNLADTAKVANGDIIGGIQKLMMEPANGGKLLNFAESFFSANPGVKVGTVFNATKPSSAFLSHVASADPSFASMLGAGPSGAGTAKGLLTNMLGINQGSVEIAGKQVMKAVQQSVLQSGYGATTATVGQALVGSGALLIIGVGLFGAAAAVKLLRMKGKHSSRLQIMQDIINQINPISDTPGPDPVDPVEEEDCVEKARKLWEGFQEGDFVLYEEQGSRYGEIDFSPAIIAKVGTKAELGDTFEGQLSDPVMGWDSEEGDSEPEGELKEAKPSISYGDPDKGGRQTSSKDTKQKIQFIIRSFQTRGAKSRGELPATGNEQFASVFRKEGDGECRPYIKKLTEDEFKDELAKLPLQVAEHHKQAALRKVSNPDSYLGQDPSKAKGYEADIWSLTRNLAGIPRIEDYKALGSNIRTGNVILELEKIYNQDIPPAPSANPNDYFVKYNLPRPDQQGITRAHRLINNFMTQAAGVMGSHIERWEKALKAKKVTKKEAAAQIDRANLSLALSDFKKLLNKKAVRPLDKSLREDIINLFRKAKLVEDESATSDREAKEAEEDSIERARQKREKEAGIMESYSRWKELAGIIKG